MDEQLPTTFADFNTVSSIIHREYFQYIILVHVK